MSTQIQNAKIASTMLGDEDHGVFTCYLFVEGSGWGCGFGGYGLDVYDKELKRRVGTAYGLEFIKAILATLEIPTWEKLPGTFVRVETGGVGSTISRIGHLLKDKWFDPKEFNERMKNFER